MYSRVLKNAFLVVTLACAALLPIAAAAQDAPKPAPKAVTTDDSASKWDIFLGYSYLGPHGSVDVLQPNGSTIPVRYDGSTLGANESVARYFNKYVGLTADTSQHSVFNSDSSSNDKFLSVQGGPIFRYPTEDITPFVHAMVGGARIKGPDLEPYHWGVALTLGGGLDYNTPFFNHHLAIRVFQADYQYMHDDWGAGVYGGRANINAARLSAGLVIRLGGFAPPPAITIACVANPNSIFPGDPVTVTATTTNLDPKLNAVYSWSGNGVTGSGTTATVATASLAPGSYTVNCGVKEGKKGKEGLKPWETADSTATFTVKEYEPPTISCSASPSTIKPGDSATVTAAGVSPQNRPLTYSYSAAAGTITGSGTTATFASTGAPTGPVAITCNVSDDKGHSASASTGVTITAPYVPPTPHASALCSITFENDKKRPMRVDNEAKACLDEVALDLQKQSDAKAVIVGESTADEKELPKHHKKNAQVEPFAAQRAVNTKDYLVTEKGIDASRISVATGTTDGQKVEDYLVPAGADFNADFSGTTPVDESVVKPQVRKALPERHPVVTKKHMEAKAKHKEAKAK